MLCQETSNRCRHEKVKTAGFSPGKKETFVDGGAMARRGLSLEQRNKEDVQVKAPQRRWERQDLSSRGRASLWLELHVSMSLYNQEMI